MGPLLKLIFPSSRSISSGLAHCLHSCFPSYDHALSAGSSSLHHKSCITRLLTLCLMCSQWVLTSLVSSVSHSNSVLILPNFSWHHNLRTSHKPEMNPQFTPRWLHGSIYFLSLFTSCRKVPWAPPISSTCTCILLCPVPSCTTHSFLMFFYHSIVNHWTNTYPFQIYIGLNIYTLFAFICQSLIIQSLSYSDSHRYITMHLSTMILRFLSPLLSWNYSLTCQLWHLNYTKHGFSLFLTS